MDTWLMSCRVLKRGMEEYVINRMVALAAAGGFSRITAEYLPTPKNRMVRDIYETMGFRRTGENTFAADVGAFPVLKTYIREESENEQG